MTMAARSLQLHVQFLCIVITLVLQYDIELADACFVSLLVTGVVVINEKGDDFYRNQTMKKTEIGRAMLKLKKLVMAASRTSGLYGLYFKIWFRIWRVKVIYDAPSDSQELKRAILETTVETLNIQTKLVHMNHEFSEVRRTIRENMEWMNNHRREKASLGGVRGTGGSGDGRD